MNILVVSQYYYPEPFRVHEICEGLVDKGNHVTVLTGLPNYPDGEIYNNYSHCNGFTEIINGVKVVRCKNRPRHKGIFNLILNYISFVYQACKEIKKLNDDFDIIYVYQMSPILQAYPAIKMKNKYGIPIFLYCLDIWPESIRAINENRVLSIHNPIYLFIKSISKKIYNSVDFIGITSPSFKQYLNEICNVPTNKIGLLYQHSDDVIDNNFKKKYNNNTCLNFYFMGNIGKAQNLDVIVNAVNNIRNYSNFKVHIVGSGSALSHLKRMVIELKLEEKIIFHGKRPYCEMINFYNDADCCLLTLSCKTNVGLTIPGKLQNYMSAGKPVIGCINGDASIIIKNAKCGLCVESGNYKELSEAMLYLIKNKNLIPDFALNSRKFYEQNFTLERHLNQLILMLERILNNENLRN